MDTLDTLPAPTIPAVDLGVLLGRGQFGAVYRAHHRTLDVDVAVKIVSGEALALSLALDEARLIARLDHPNLVRIHDAGRVGPSIYLVLELMDGGSYAAAHGVPAPRLADIAAQLLAGVQALHDAHVIHRDIKPANCLVRTRDGRVKVADLGIARDRATASSDFAGTLAFMAPELFDDSPRFGERSDLYAVGMTLLSLALPGDPFPYGSTAELVEWARAGKRPRVGAARPDLPPGLAALIDGLLATDPEARPANAADGLASLLAVDRAPVTVAADAQRVGPWVVGELIYDATNWRASAATHASTGAAARFCQVRAAPVRGARDDPRGGRACVAARAPRVARRARLGRSAGWPVRGDGAARTRVARHRRDRRGRGARARGRRRRRARVPPRHVRARLPGRRAGDGVRAPHRARRAARLAGVLRPRGLAARDAIRHAAARVHPAVRAARGVRDRTIERPVDVYGLGEILYFLCAGASAYDAPTMQALVAAKARPPVPLRERAPAITQPTARIAADMMAPDPRARPTAAMARDELRRIAARLRG